jgi:chromate transporter
MTGPHVLDRRAVVAAPEAARDVTIGRIFAAFLLIGATSFGGGVIAHLRTNLVARRRWVDDKTFLELLAIGQTVPGLIAVNLAILVGDRLHGVAGAIAAIAGLCLPGAALMYGVAIGYRLNGERVLLAAGLEGVAAAALGLIVATTFQLGRKSLTQPSDLAFILLTIAGVNRLHLSEPLVLVVVGLLAIFWNRPR